MTRTSWKRRNVLIGLFIFFTSFQSLKATGSDDNPTGTEVEKKREKVFVIHAPIKNLQEFEALAKQASRLKQFGRVELNLSNLADKSFYEIPEGRNFWHDYASYNPTPYKYFPDPKIAPFIPADFVKKNKDLILAKAKVLRKYDLKGAFWSYEPNFLPEAFFEKYPQMLGPRVDHPRRGNYPAFAPCISVEETQEMYANMVESLLKNVPEINTFFFKTNDAGSGICWSDWQYVGPNGPAHCKHHSMGTRVATLMNTFKKGAEGAGKDITIYLTGSMFSDQEKADIYKHLPAGAYYQSHNSDEVKGINSMIVGNYPVRGLYNPQEIFDNLDIIEDESTNTVFISFRSSYDRGYEHFSVIEKFIDQLIDGIENPLDSTSNTEEQQLRRLSKEWGGEEGAGFLFDAFTTLEKARQYKGIALPSASGMYWGVSERHITRPLVVAPQLLTPEEESYFMPHVFNPSEEEARMDYIDIHGARRVLSPGAMGRYVAMVNKAVELFEKGSKNAPEKAFIENMAKAWKIHSSIYRSIGNFAEAQAIRDRNADKLSAKPHRPDKIPTWEGDPELLAFNGVMRDELDNTQQLIDVLENGGMEFISHADDPKYEDTFLLGPNLIEQLKLKRKVMMDHWTDIEDYMATPFK